jgi:hypothetical protein
VSPDGFQVVGDGGPPYRSVDAGAAAVPAAFHPEGVLQAGDPGLTPGAPRATALKPALPLVGYPLPGPMARLG